MTLCALKPITIVMDLAKAYHTFAKKRFPVAIRIADRYHVNRYVTEALQAVRKSVQKRLNALAKKALKQYFCILGKRNDQLSIEERMILKRLLQYDKFTVGKRLLSTGMIVVHRINKQKRLSTLAFARSEKFCTLKSKTVYKPCVIGKMKSVITINYVSTMRQWKGKITSLKPYNVVTFSRVTYNTRKKRFY